MFILNGTQVDASAVPEDFASCAGAALVLLDKYARNVIFTDGRGNIVQMVDDQNRCLPAPRSCFLCDETQAITLPPTFCDYCCMPDDNLTLIMEKDGKQLPTGNFIAFGVSPLASKLIEVNAPGCSKAGVHILSFTAFGVFTPELIGQIERQEALDFLNARARALEHDFAEHAKARF